MSVRKRHLEDEGLGSSCESDISDEPPAKPPPKKRPRSGGSRAGKKKDKVAAVHAGAGDGSIEDETGAKRKLVGITPVVRNGSAQWQAQLSHKVRAPRVRCRAFFGHHETGRGVHSTRASVPAAGACEGRRSSLRAS